MLHHYSIRQVDNHSMLMYYFSKSTHYEERRMFSAAYEIDRRLIVAMHWGVRQVEKFLKIRWISMAHVLQSLNRIFLFIQLGLGVMTLFVTEEIAIGLSLFVLAFVQSEARESLDDVIEGKLGPIVIERRTRARRLWRLIIGYTLLGLLVFALFGSKISFVLVFGVASLCLTLATLYFESTTSMHRNSVS